MILNGINNIKRPDQDSNLGAPEEAWISNPLQYHYAIWAVLVII